MKIGIYGGTYNPPHLGHLAAARTAVDALKLDKLLLMPAAVPPHKALPENTPSQEHRLAMVEKLADAMDLPGVVEVSTLELEREGKSYTSETLEELRRRYPKAELWLLMGTDMFLTLHLWHDAKTILRLAKICAFGRTEQDGEAVFAPQREFLTREYHADVVTITLPGLIDVSSTQLRELLVRGKGREYLLPSVYGYILMNHLYGTAAGLLLFHDPPQAGGPRDGGGGGGGQAGQILGRRPGAGPPRRYFARLHQIPGPGGPVAFV